MEPSNQKQISLHTPGPWYFDETATELLITTADKSAICEMFIGDGFGGLRNYIANAKLIAAAPETKRQRDALLEACKELVTAVPIQNHALCGDAKNNCAIMVNALQKGRAAIALTEKGG